MLRIGPKGLSENDPNYELVAKGALRCAANDRGAVSSEFDSILDQEIPRRSRPIVVLAEDDRACLDDPSQWLEGEVFTGLAR